VFEHASNMSEIVIAPDPDWPDEQGSFDVARIAQVVETFGCDSISLRGQDPHQLTARIWHAASYPGGGVSGIAPYIGRGVRRLGDL